MSKPFDKKQIWGAVLGTRLESQLWAFYENLTIPMDMWLQTRNLITGGIVENVYDPDGIITDSLFNIPHIGTWAVQCLQQCWPLYESCR